MLCPWARHFTLKTSLDSGENECLLCGLESRSVQNFQGNIMFLPSQSWDILKMLCPWARHFTLKTSLDSGENEYLVGQKWQCVR